MINRFFRAVTAEELDGGIGSATIRARPNGNRSDSSGARLEAGRGGITRWISRWMFAILSHYD